MASIVSRSNGTYLVRVSCGVDSNGKQIARAKTFKPSKPNLPYHFKTTLQYEKFIYFFVEACKNYISNYINSKMMKSDKSCS